MDSLVPDGDPEVFEEYLENFLDQLRADHRRWLAHVAARGADAEWTLEKGVGRKSTPASRKASGCPSASWKIQC